MTTIAIPTALADVLRKTLGPTRLVDEQGKVVGEFAPVQAQDDELTPKELAELKRRLTGPGPWYTTEQVLAHIDAAGKHE